MLTKSNGKNSMSSMRKKQLVFYCLILLIPVVHFCIFYIGVNVNSILLMFKKYDVKSGYFFVGFENFKDLFTEITDINSSTRILLLNGLKNSLTLGALVIFIGMSLAIIFSYYIYKGFFASGIFKIFLFLPNMISSVIMVIIFKKFSDAAIPAIVESVFHVKIEGLLSSETTRLPTLFFYTIWVGFGVQIMMYSGSMSSIDQSLVEAGDLDGCSAIKEFIHITIPCIYPTIVTFTVVSVAGIFVNQMNLFSFYGPGAYSSDPKIITLGYYLYKQSYGGAIKTYPGVATLGFIFTIISIPLTFLVKYLMEKFGPSER